VSPPQKAVDGGLQNRAANGQCPSETQKGCTHPVPIFPKVTFTKDASGLLSTTSHLLKLHRAPRPTTGFVQPRIVWRLRATQFLFVMCCLAGCLRRS
jgi:hypothetical protein